MPHKKGNEEWMDKSHWDSKQKLWKNHNRKNGDIYQYRASVSCSDSALKGWEQCFVCMSDKSFKYYY